MARSPYTGKDVIDTVLCLGGRVTTAICDAWVALLHPLTSGRGYWRHCHNATTAVVDMKSDIPYFDESNNDLQSLRYIQYYRHA